jgi:poly(3-hydroxyalkanoate) depolymerase
MSADATWTAGARTLVVDGQRLRIAVRGGDGTGDPPLLMLNGIGARLEVLDPLVRALDPGRPVLRVDVPGTGGSPPGFLPYGFPQLAMLLHRLLDRLGYDRADVLGYSWGGGLAQQYALQYPDRCRRLVLVSTSTGAVSVPGRPLGLLAMLTPRRYGTPRDVAAMAGIVDGPGAAGATAAAASTGTSANGGSPGHRVAPGGAPSDVVGYVHQLAAVSTWTSLPFLPMIGQRTLVITGTADHIVPRVNARILARLIPRATLVECPGGHAAVVTHATVMAPHISRFLA